jgi:hypothetical protein
LYYAKKVVPLWGKGNCCNKEMPEIAPTWCRIGNNNYKRNNQTSY